MDISDEDLERLALLTPKGIRGWVLTPKRKLTRDPSVAIKLERKLLLFIPRLKKMESKGIDEEKLILFLNDLLQKVRAHLRSPAMVIKTQQCSNERMPLNKKEQALFDQALKEVFDHKKRQKILSKEQSAKDKARKFDHIEKYGPPAGSRAKGPSKSYKGSVYTVQGGAPGLGKRS